MIRTTWLAALASMALAGSAFAQTTGGSPSKAAPPDQPPVGSPATNGVGNDTSGQPNGSTGGNESTLGGSASGSQNKTQAQKRTGSDTLDKSTSQGGDRMGATFAANQLVGQIKSIDRDQKQVTIDQAGQQQSLQLSDNATVFVEGRLGSAQDLKEGQQVRAAYEERGGQKTLRWIEVAPQGSGSQKQQQQPQGDQSGMHDQGGLQPQGGGGVHDDAGGGGDAPKGSMGSSTQGSTMQGSSAQQQPQGGQKQASNEVIGTVTAIDQESNKLTLSGPDKEWTLNVKDQAPIFKDGQKITFDQLREGQQVRASLDPSKQSATRLEITSGASDSENSLQKAQQQRQSDDQMRKGTTNTPY